MAAGVADCDLVHSHTWYANFAGHVAKLLYGIPHVVTSHSLGVALDTLACLRHTARLAARVARRVVEFRNSTCLSSFSCPSRTLIRRFSTWTITTDFGMEILVLP